MTNNPGRSAAGAMMFVSLFARLFWGMAVDYFSVGSAVWLCPLLGLVISLPFGFAMHMMASLGNDSPWGNLTSRCPTVFTNGAGLVLALILLFDGAVSMRLLANTANVLGLGNTAIVVLLLPLSLLVLFSVRLGADAEGNSARLWMRILPLLFLVMLLAQLGSYNAAWLAPMLGNGFREILSGGIYCGGCIAVLMLSWMIAVPDHCKSSHWKYVFWAVVCASALLITMQMLCPTLIDLDLSRTSRLKLVLANGRITLSLQMVMIVLWYGGLFHLIATEAVTAVCFLKQIFPVIPHWGLAAGISAVMTAIGASSLAASSKFLTQLKWSFPLVGFIIAGLLLSGLRGRRAKTCGKQR